MSNFTAVIKGFVSCWGYVHTIEKQSNLCELQRKNKVKTLKIIFLTQVYMKLFFADKNAYKEVNWGRSYLVYLKMKKRNVLA